MACIYSLSCPDTLEVRYIGKSINPTKRLGQHLRMAKTKKYPLHCWLDKLLTEGKNPVLSILETTENWQQAEKSWILRYSNLLNLTEGGDGLHNPTPEVRAKISKAKQGKKGFSFPRLDLRGKPRPQTVKEAVSLARKGKSLSAEHRNKLSSVKIGKPSLPRFSYILIKDGNLVEVFNLRAFSDLKGLNYRNMRSVTSGGQKSYEGYSLHLKITTKQSCH